MNEVESISTLCFRAMESSSYEIRLAIAHLLSQLLSLVLKPPKSSGLGLFSIYLGYSTVYIVFFILAASF